MAYTTPSNVRDILGITVDDASDALLNSFINKADNIIFNTIAIHEIDGKTGTSKFARGGSGLDGQTTKLYVEHIPIADKNFDKIINASDIVFYGWKDPNDESSKVDLTSLVTSVDWLSGQIILSSAPSTDTYKRLTVDYYYYRYEIDWDLIELASTFYAAYLFIIREVMLLPDDVSWATIKQSYMKGKLPKYERMYKEYKRVMNIIMTRPFERIDVDWKTKARRVEDYESGEVAL